VKILYHHRTLAKDGMEIHIQQMVSALRRRGHDVLVVGPDITEDEPTKAARATRLVRRMPSAATELLELAYNSIVYARLKSAFARFEPHVLYERYNLFLLAGLRLCRTYDVPRLLEVNSPLAHERAEHGTLYWRSAARRLEIKAWTGADLVMPVSHVLADTIHSAGVSKSRIHVIQNGVDLDRFSPNISGADVRNRLGLHNQIVLGFVGFVRPWHGLNQVIDVLANYGRTCDLHLLIIGDGPERFALEQMASDRGVIDRVQFVGAVSHGEIPRYVAAFDIALQPSAVEYACPLKLIEYMAMAKAIIAPDQPNIRELIDHSTTGLLVSGRSELTDAIVSLAGNLDLRKNLGSRAAREVVKRGLTWEANAERVELLATGLIRPANPS
jgi:glycosyltransferase involved in cell wall biosynthesis